ncbi:MAG TPA: ABC transporter permease [Acidiphilium sp.]|nr:ABC transporter permease [Acidiphilium sp.]
MSASGTEIRRGKGGKPRRAHLHTGRSKLHLGMIGAAPILLLIIAWFAATGPLGLIAPLKFPSPATTLASLETIAGPGYAGAPLLVHIETSLSLVLAGFAAATLTGIPLGLLLGCNRYANAFINPVFQLLRPIAPIAWIPLTILWFGLGDIAKIFVVWLAAFAPAVINTQTAVRGVNRTIVEAARVHGANSAHLFLDVTIPAALPGIFTGLQLSLQACWMVLVAAELVGAYAGLGHVMMVATDDLDPGMIFVAMLCVAMLGVAMSLFLARLEAWVLPWRR